MPSQTNRFFQKLADRARRGRVDQVLGKDEAERELRKFLEARRLPVRKIAFDWGREGMTDQDIVAKLHTMRRITGHHPRRGAL